MQNTQINAATTKQKQHRNKYDETVDKYFFSKYRKDNINSVT
jgi:hypothetical protein